tara:strand:+ start:718 stop:1200 length:483 start_codon:yes stop_codon:yes gene_type:complete
MKKLLAIVVLGLLWSNSVFAEIDAEKIKTIKCELENIVLKKKLIGSDEQLPDEKYEGEMLKQFYKEGVSKIETFKIKKDRIKSNTFKYFDSLWIKDNVITGLTSIDKEQGGFTTILERSISIDLNKMFAVVNKKISAGQNGNYKVVYGPIILSYSKCTAK